MIHDHDANRTAPVDGACKAIPGRLPRVADLHGANRRPSRRRGKSMHPETRRAKLRGLEGESVTMDIAELPTEWMQEKAARQ